MIVYHGSLVEVMKPELRESENVGDFGRCCDMAEITQDNLYLLLPWKVAGLAELWAKDLGVSPLEAMQRLYRTPFYARLADESTKLWHYSPEQLYVIFAA